MHQFIHEADRPSHLRIEDCRLLYGDAALLPLRTGCRHVAVIGCELGWGPAGILYRGESNDAPSHFVIRDNHIHDIGVLPGHRNRLSHGIGLDGPVHGLIEGNRIERCGNGIQFYAFARQPAHDNRVRGNFVKDSHTLGESKGIGIGTACNQDSRSKKTGNVFDHNIIANCSAGFILQFEETQQVHHNVVLNCEVGILSIRNNLPAGPRAEVTNNIFRGIRDKHVKLQVRGAGTSFRFDHNLYFPIGDERLFLLRGPEGDSQYSFRQWKTQVRAGFTFDPRSIAAEPLFANRSRAFERASDFKLRPDSPAIDAGCPTPFKLDFSGDPVLGAPDLGAFECGARRPKP
jgi:hypothetical protein